MPYYDYQCRKCGCVGEYCHEMRGKPTDNCHHCDADPVNLVRVFNEVETHWRTQGNTRNTELKFPKGCGFSKSKELTERYCK